MTQPHVFVNVLAPLLSSALRLSDPQAESHYTGQHLGAPLADVPAAQHMMLFSESAQFELLLVFGVRYLEKALLVGELWIISCLLKYVGILENLVVYVDHILNWRLNLHKISPIVLIGGCSSTYSIIELY